jgi:hypothetical protein
LGCSLISIRTSLDYIAKDVTEYVIPFSKHIARQLLDLDPTSSALAAPAVEDVTREPSATAAIPPVESEELKLLRDIREQIGALAAAAQAANAASQAAANAALAASQAADAAAKAQADAEKAGPTPQLHAAQGNPRTARPPRRSGPP